MKRFFGSMLLIVGLLAGCQTNSSSVQTASNRSPSTDEKPTADQQPDSRDLTAKLYVKGMSCPLCANNIDKQLLQVPGVRDVSVNLGSGEVRAKLASKDPPTRDQLARAIERSGFTLDRIEMPTP